MIDRREFLSLLAAALATPVPPAASPEPIICPAGAAISFDIENLDACWSPWVQYIEPGKLVTFEYPFHLQRFGVDAPGELPSHAPFSLLINGVDITGKQPLELLVMAGRSLEIFPTIPVLPGTMLEIRCTAPDVIFCVQGQMKRPVPIDMDWSDDPDEEEDFEDLLGWGWLAAP